MTEILELLQKEIPTKELEVGLQLVAWKHLSEKEDLGSHSFSQFYESSVSFQRLKEVLADIPSDTDDLFGIDDSIAISDETLIKVLHAVSNLEDFRFSDLIYAEERTDYFYPQEVVDLVAKIGTVSDVSSAYVLYPGNYALPHVLAQSGGMQVATEGGESSKVPLLLNLLEGDRITPAFTNPLVSPSFKKADHLLAKYDLSAAVMLSSRRKWDGRDQVKNDTFNRYTFATDFVSHAVAVIEHLIAQSTKRVVVVLPSAFLDATIRAEVAFRESLLRRGIVDSVIALPSNVFAGLRGKTSVLVLDLTNSSRSTYLLNAESLYEREDRRNLISLSDILELYEDRQAVLGRSRFAAVGEAEEKSFSLLPSRYALTDTEREAEQLFSRISTTPLKQIADNVIHSQYLKEAEDSKAIKAKMVLPEDIPIAGFVTSFAKERMVSQSSPFHRDQILRSYDVLLAVRGTEPVVGIMPPDLSGTWLPSQAFVIMRVMNNEKLSIFLTMYLKTDFAQSILRRLQKGVAFPSISTKAVRELEIPMLPKSDMEIVYSQFNRQSEIGEQIKKSRQEIDEIGAKIQLMILGEKPQK